jgi:hypothetical protein
MAGPARLVRATAEPLGEPNGGLRFCPVRITGALERRPAG